MNTFSTLGSFVVIFYGFWLINITYSLRFWIGWIQGLYRSVNMIFMGIGTPLFAMSCADPILFDVYNKTKSEIIQLYKTSESFASDYNTKQFALRVILAFIFLNAYDWLVLRPVRKKKRANSVTVDNPDEAKKERKSIITKRIAAIGFFILMATGEGIIQDILYKPYIKPALCKYFRVACD